MRPSPIFELSESTAQANFATEANQLIDTNNQVQVNKLPQQFIENSDDADMDMAVEKNCDESDLMKLDPRLETICDSLAEESTAEGDYPIVNNGSSIPHHN